MKHLVVAALNEENTSWIKDVTGEWFQSVFTNFRPPGRESYAILTKIISSYDYTEPDDEFVFVQGDPFAHDREFLQHLADPAMRAYGIRWKCNLASQPYDNPLQPDSFRVCNSFCDALGIPRQESAFDFVLGAQMRVTGVQIKAHPVEFYQAMLSLTYVNPKCPWIYERLLPTIFGIAL